MTEDINNDFSKTVFGLLWLSAVCAAFIYIGTHSATTSGYAVVFNNVSYSSLRDAILSLSLKCAVDISMLLVITLAAKPYVSMAVATALCAYRGLALGVSASFCAENAVDTVSVAMIVSFVMISCLIIVYTVLLNRIKNGTAIRVGLYLITSGAAVMIRILPVMLT